MKTQAARMIVVVAFSRADNDKLVLVQAYDSMQFDTAEGAVRMARYLTAECAGVLAWSEVQPDIAAYGPPTVRFQSGEVPEME